jgi:hypothetical protein
MALNTKAKDARLIYPKWGNTGRLWGVHFILGVLQWSYVTISIREIISDSFYPSILDFRLCLFYGDARRV